MIAKLTGLLDETAAETAVIDVGGVGYLVHASARTLAGLGIVGDRVTVFTQMQVSENDQRLIGFASAAERDWFRLLTAVQGVGSKVALAILSALDSDALHSAIASGDSAMVARANGVGPKLASRIVNELKDKAGGIALGSGAGARIITGAGSGAASPASDALSALTGLGFKHAEASNAVALALEELGADASLDALVRLALKRATR